MADPGPEDAVPNLVTCHTQATDGDHGVATTSSTVPLNSPEVTSKLIQNPLSDMSREELIADADTFAFQKGLLDHRLAFHKGALMAKVQNVVGGFEALDDLSEGDKALLRHENTHRWSSQPKMLYFLCALCAGCAIVQGMDQTAINGAQEFYFDEFGIRDRAHQGLVNGAPYLAASLIGCWLNAPLNSRWGRRGTIAFACFWSFVTGVWQAVSPNWICFIAARFVLGIAVGAKSSTTPVYAAECAPKNIRGALTMMWQTWTAFGIMLGFAASLAFQNVDFLGTNSQWRWMLGSTSLPPLIVGACVYLLPESPRWYMEKGNFPKAFESMKKLRSSDIQAARDMYLAWKFIEVEEQTKAGRNLLKELFTVRRNWRAAQSAWFCMLMQQFCGVNVIAYYSTMIFKEAGFTRSNALLASFGCGVLNWVFALPAIYTIDTFGRRNLLLVTFPAMFVCLLWTGCSLYNPVDEMRIGLTISSIYVFMVCYSPGLGPVPFTYSAEAFPLHIRALGMSSATAITWAFNFIISFTWPKMMQAMTPSGGFFWYAGWNLFGFVFAYFYLPETKNRTLEELDSVFSVRNRDHAAYYAQRLPWTIKKILGRDVDPMPPLYETESLDRPLEVVEELKP